jgi:hypothetical protein
MFFKDFYFKTVLTLLYRSNEKCGLVGCDVLKNMNYDIPQKLSYDFHNKEEANRNFPQATEQQALKMRL